MVILRALASLSRDCDSVVRRSPGAPLIRAKANFASAPLTGAAFISTAAIGPSAGAPDPGLGIAVEAQPARAAPPASTRMMGRLNPRSARIGRTYTRHPVWAVSLAGSRWTVQETRRIGSVTGLRRKPPRL